jgi:arabinofuranan 3-O-arabinosyltransferase
VLTQAPQDLFARPGTQSVAYFPDASSISASGSGSDLTGFNSSLRAANAFDGLTSTAWRDGGFEDPVGIWIKIDFRKPETLSRLSLSPWLGGKGTRAVSAASLHFDDGSSVKVRFPTGQATVRAQFTPRTTRSLTIRVDGVRGDGTSAVGFTEIHIPGVDLQEYIATPEHLFTSTDTALRSALQHDQVSYLFRRSIQFLFDNEELRIRRRFLVAGDRSWKVTAQLSPTDPSPDRIVDQLVGGDVGAYGTSRVGSPSTSRGGLAVDDDPETAWAGRPVAGESLNIHFPVQSVDHLKITLQSGPNDYPANALDVQIGGGAAHTVTLVPQTCSTGPCRVGTLDVPSVDTGRVKIVLADGDGGGRPVRISDVAIDGPNGPVPPAPAPVDGACATGLINVDGHSVGLHSATPLLPALDAGRVSLVSCTPLKLKAGHHRLDTTAGARVDQVQLDSEPTRPLAAVSPSISEQLVRRSPTSIDLAVQAPEPGIVMTGQSYDPGWKATANGHDLGTPFELEGQSAWIVPAGTTRVHMTFGPQRWYSIALAAAAFGLVLCAWLLLRGRKPVDDPGGRARPVYRRRVRTGPAPP